MARLAGLSSFAGVAAVKGSTVRGCWCGEVSLIVRAGRNTEKHAGLEVMRTILPPATLEPGKRLWCTWV